MLVTEFGDLADFIIGNKIVYPPAPIYKKLQESQLDAMGVRKLYLKAVENTT